MGFLRIFSGKDPEEYEQKGDDLFENGEYGAAKMEYAVALSKVEKKSSEDPDLINRLQEKIAKVKNALAILHKQSGEELMKAEHYEEAEDKLHLAMELAQDPDLMIELEGKLLEIAGLVAEDNGDLPDFDWHKEEVEDPDYQERLDEYFIALCGSMTEEMMALYQAYGTNFKIGYVALNQGDFELAVTKLLQAKEENLSNNVFISFELAKAYLNLKQHTEAKTMLTDFVKENSEFMPGYQLLCELYWELKEFDLANQLLHACPPSIQDSLPIQLLRGETLFQAEKFEEAESFYLNFLQSAGWDEHIARALALTYEALGKKEEACQLFGEILEECRGCGVRLDPSVKRKYLDLCLEAGQYSTKILELYLSLIQEDPANKAQYYRKISRIYGALGNEKEAGRYQLFAHKLEDKGQGNIK